MTVVHQKLTSDGVDGVKCISCAMLQSISGGSAVVYCEGRTSARRSCALEASVLDIVAGRQYDRASAAKCAEIRRLVARVMSTKHM